MTTYTYVTGTNPATVQRPDGDPVPRRRSPDLHLRFLGPARGHRGDRRPAMPVTFSYNDGEVTVDRRVGDADALLLSTTTATW